MIKPRRGRFNELTGRPVPMPGQSAVHMVLGTMLLWLGWIGFNATSTPSVVGEGGSTLVARVAATTMLSGCTGGLSATLIERWLGRRLRPESNAITDNKTWSVEAACNGILTGLVSVTAGCAAVTSWAAVIIGILSGAVYFATAELVLRIFKVDDVLNAFAVHAAGGLWGLLAAALFATPGYDADSYGAFYGMAEPLGAAAVGALAIVGWSVLWGLLTFGALRAVGLLRVSTVDEVAGMDTLHHGGSAYGVDATEAPPPEYPPQYTAPRAPRRSAAGGDRDAGRQRRRAGGRRRDRLVDHPTILRMIVGP